MSDNKTDRRGFLKTAVIAGGAAAATGAVVTSNAKETTESTEPVVTETESAGYRETAHVREYYRLARF